MTGQHQRGSTSIFLLAGALLLTCFTWETIAAESATPPMGSAPAADVLRPGHLGRTSGDLARMVHFYHDLLGLDVAGDGQIPRFFSSQALIDFVSSPPQSEFRALNLPIPGTSNEPGVIPAMTVEVLEFRNIDRDQYLPRLQDPGVSNLKLLVRRLEPVLEKLKAEGVPIITTGGEPLSVRPMPGLEGGARAIIVRDPDGYPVELVELTPTPTSSAPATSNVIGAHVSRVVNDLDTTLDYYRHLVGPDLRTWTAAQFTRDDDYNNLRDTPGAERRLATMLIPGANVVVELIQYRGIEAKPYQPIIQDIGVGHMAFMVKDMDLIMQRLGELGRGTLGRNGGWYNLSPATRALYTQDPDGFFLEIMENRPVQ